MFTYNRKSSVKYIYKKKNTIPSFAINAKIDIKRRVI